MKYIFLFLGKTSLEIFLSRHYTRKSASVQERQGRKHQEKHEFHTKLSKAKQRIDLPKKD
jgi:hypothetical protein